MNRILLVDIDSRIPNLALKKIEKYHVDRGDRVIWSKFLPARGMDKAYVSCVFDWNREKAAWWEDSAEIGGSGYDLTKTLPPEIEAVHPKINLGFTTRGCIRRCPFCVVPKKEGTVRVVADVLDLWDFKASQITLLDNNILAEREHFFRICDQLRRYNLAVDFNQGLDIRLIDDEIAQILATLRFVKEVRFSLDDAALIPLVKEKFAILRKFSDRQNYFFYVLVGYDTTIPEDMERLDFLKAENCRPYVQLFGPARRSKLYREFSRWVNLFWPFQKYSFEQWLALRNYTPDSTEETGRLF